MGLTDGAARLGHGGPHRQAQNRHRHAADHRISISRGANPRIESGCSCAESPGLLASRAAGWDDTWHVQSRVALTAVALLVVSVDVSGSSASSAVSVVFPNRSEIVAAFGHLVGPPRSAVALGPYVQGVDGAMAAALAKGAVNQRADEASLLPDGTMRVSVVRRLSGSVASVAFGITQRGQGPPYTWHFVGTAVYSQRRWMASWTTVCMLVEQEGVLCPNPPAGVVSALPLPYSVTAREQASEQSPDLIRPGALALTASGDLLIADSFRDQIVEWHPNGELTVFAGTGQTGFSGDGEPALDARLSNLGGMAMSPSGTLYFVDGSRVRAISAAGIITTVAGNGRSGPTTGNGPALREPLDPSDVAVAKNGTVYIAGGNEILTLSASGELSTFAKGSPPYGDVATPRGRSRSCPRTSPSTAPATSMSSPFRPRRCSRSRRPE